MLCFVSVFLVFLLAQQPIFALRVPENDIPDRPPPIDLTRGKGDIRQLWEEYMQETVQNIDAPPGAMLNALKPDATNRWTNYQDSNGNYIIPYTISGTFDATEHAIIDGAMASISANSCIVFQPRSNQEDYIDLQNVEDHGCYTLVGRSPGKNVVMLESNKVGTCVLHQTVVHELMHTIGLWHEHMRDDRDQYIRVHTENIPKYYMPQFNLVDPNVSTSYGVKYDYRSVMHYGKSAFAYSPNLISMETKDPSFENVIGTVLDASPSDYAKICNIYNCKKCMGSPFQENQTIVDSSGNAINPVPQATTTKTAATSTTPGPGTSAGSGTISIGSSGNGGNIPGTISVNWDVNGKSGNWSGKLGDSVPEIPIFKSNDSEPKTNGTMVALGASDGDHGSVVERGSENKGGIGKSEQGNSVVEKENNHGGDSSSVNDDVTGNENGTGTEIDEKPGTEVPKSSINSVATFDGITGNSGDNGQVQSSLPADTVQLDWDVNGKRGNWSGTLEDLPDPVANFDENNTSAEDQNSSVGNQKSSDNDKTTEIKNGGRDCRRKNTRLAGIICDGVVGKQMPDRAWRLICCTTTLNDGKMTFSPSDSASIGDAVGSEFPSKTADGFCTPLLHGMFCSEKSEWMRKALPGHVRKMLCCE